MIWGYSEMGNDKIFSVFRKFGWFLIPLTLAANFIASGHMNETVGLQKDIISGTTRYHVPKSVFIFLVPAILTLLYVNVLNRKENAAKGIIISIIIFLGNFFLIFVNLK